MEHTGGTLPATAGRPPRAAAAPLRTVPFGRPLIGAAERAAVAEVLEGPTLTHGPRVRRFEERFAAFTGAPHAVAVNSCTAALHLAYLHLGLGPGDEVIVPAQTHVATAHAVELCGARCVFADCELDTGNVDLDRLDGLVTPATRAVSVVHFLGRPVDMDRVLDLAARHALFVVEDCALALGARRRGVHVGLHGDAGVFSFYPVKHVTTGEGGMLITRRDDVAAAASKQRAFGIDRNVPGRRPMPGDYDVEQLGHNYRLSETAAALGIEQMRRLPGFLAARRANHEALAAQLRDLDGVRILESPRDGEECAWYALGLVLDGRLEAGRPAIMGALQAAGVGFSVYYPRPVPAMSYFQGRYGHRSDTVPMASRMSRRSLTLPVGPHLEAEDVDYVARVVREAVTSVSR